MAEQKREGPFERLGETVGGAIGKAAGRANDMAMGAVGSLLGAAMRQIGDWWSTPEAERVAGSFGDAEDRACRQHFDSSAGGSAGRSYERARPLYHFGYVAGRNPEYRSRSFDQVETELEKAWEKVGREEFGAWDQVRDPVSFGYTYRSPGAPNPT